MNVIFRPIGSNDPSVACHVKNGAAMSRLDPHVPRIGSGRAAGALPSNIQQNPPATGVRASLLSPLFSPLCTSHRPSIYWPVTNVSRRRPTHVVSAPAAGCTPFRSMNELNERAARKNRPYCAPGNRWSAADSRLKCGTPRRMSAAKSNSRRCLGHWGSPASCNNPPMTHPRGRRAGSVQARISLLEVNGLTALSLVNVPSPRLL